MPQPNQVIISPQGKRWSRVLGWSLVIVLALAILGLLYMCGRSYLRHRDFWDVTPMLVPLCFGIRALQSKWIAQFPSVLTVAPEGLHLRMGAFPFRRRWLAPWKSATLLRYDHKLVLAGVKARIFRTVTIECYLSNTSRDMLIERLKSLGLTQGIELPSEELKLSLYEPEDAQDTAGSNDFGKFWKG